MNRDAKAMISSGLKIMSAVDPCCQVLSLTLSVISRLFGSGFTESVVVMYGPRKYCGSSTLVVTVKNWSPFGVEDGATSYTQVGRNDSRVTRFGAFIRKTSLDELPQLFNVLHGDMSIVGPRPHAVAVNEQYRRQIPGYMVRHKVKPGITGWAQVNGYRGGDDLDSMTMRITLDLEYLRHWSVGLDLIIMLKTAAMVWNDRHAY